MLRILSDLTITSRVDYSPDSGTTYKQGSWVLSDGKFNKARGKVAVGPVFNMAQTATTLSTDTTATSLTTGRDATTGASGKITAITGPLRGVTDQYTTAAQWGTPGVGDPLTTMSGLLAKATIGTDVVVAVLEKIHSNYEHRGTTYATAWEFKTV